MFCHYQTNAPPVEVSYNKDSLFVVIVRYLGYDHLARMNQSADLGIISSIQRCSKLKDIGDRG